MSFDEQVTIHCGASQIMLCPLEPALWRPLALAHPGPAGLCLALLPRAGVQWRAVMDNCQESSPTSESLARLPAGLLGDLLPAMCAPWLRQEEAEELAALQRYAQARADFPGLDCAECRAQESRGEGTPSCRTCPKGRPPESAEAALLIHDWLAPGPAGAWFLRAMERSLGPREQRLLAMRLALLRAMAVEAARPVAPSQGP